jgi:outer membrane protein assembly factor BamB
MRRSSTILPPLWRNLDKEQPLHRQTKSTLAMMMTRISAGLACAYGLLTAFAAPVSATEVVSSVIALPDAPFVIPQTVTINDEWYTYRYDGSRTGTQPWASNLADPNKVGTLSVKWSFPGSTPPAGPPVGAFRSSPIVVDDTVFIGNDNGYFYTLDAATGRLKWQYPRDSDSALLGSDPLWRYGIQSSASYWHRRDVVIFGAQDPSLGPLGSGARLFALDAKTGVPIWKSEPIAIINGKTTVDAGQGSPASLTELHQRITFSAPLIFDNKAYVGIHDDRDNPIQLGRVIAVDLTTGGIDHSFQFQAVGTPPSTVPGGGVWNALATDGTGVYFTTGNTRIPWCVYPYKDSHCPLPFEPEPTPNYGLSMIRVDKDTGAVVWHFNAVPFDRDGDPDWGAGAAVMSTSCGELIASVQKDGWSYAVRAGDGTPGPPGWQFPPTGFGPAFLNAVHGDDDYRRPGAAWNDVFIVRTGGENLVVDGASAGHSYLTALNACATTERDRVRWIANIPNNMETDQEGHTISYSTPTVTGGIVFIGTNKDPSDQKGHLVVLGDPSVVPAAGVTCSNMHYSPQDCASNGYVIVPIPTLLASFAMPDGGSLAAMRNEPVLAKGRVFVATRAGHVYMLEP